MKTEILDTNKQRWGQGPWVDEPDKANWIDEETNLDCMIHRNGSGGLCGYVAVTAGHPWFEKDYGDIPVDVHWGLTYANSCQGALCHVPEAGRPDAVWWVGFDCVHAGDLSPSAQYPGEIYRDFAYVQSEVKKLARQAAEAASLVR